MADKKGIWIPIEILQMDGISLSDRVILTEIMSLSVLPKGCEMENAEFQRIFNVSQATITRAIGRLEKAGHIETRLLKAKTGTIRHIDPLVTMTTPPLVNVTTPPSQCEETPLVTMTSHIRNKNTKNKYSKNTKNSLPAVKENQSLHMSIQQAFISKVGKFTDYGKEGKAIKGLISKAENWSPDNPNEFIKSLITAYYEMRQTDKFFGKQPFLPSALNSSGIFDRVMVKFETDHEEPDPEIDEYFARKMAEKRAAMASR